MANILKEDKRAPDREWWLESDSSGVTLVCSGQGDGWEVLKVLTDSEGKASVRLCGHIAGDSSEPPLSLTGNGVIVIQ